MTYSSIYKKVCDELNSDPLDYRRNKKALKNYEVLASLSKKGLSQKEIEDARDYAWFKLFISGIIKRNQKI